jgi:hypothetical protein
MEPRLQRPSLHTVPSGRIICNRPGSTLHVLLSDWVQACQIYYICS